MRPARIRYWTAGVCSVLLGFAPGCVEELDLNNSHDPHSTAFVPLAPVVFGFPASERRVQLSVTPRSAFVNVYILERRLGSGVFVTVATVPSSVRDIVDTSGIRTDTTYVYRVGAVGASGNVGHSSEVPIRVPFPSPGNVSVAGDREDRINLVWSDSSSFEAGFRITRAAGNNPPELLGEVQANGWMMTDQAPVAGTVYTYTVNAFTSLNMSAVSTSPHIGFLPPGATLLQQISAVQPIPAADPEGSVVVFVAGHTLTVRRVNGGVIKTVSGGYTSVLAFEPNGYFVAASVLGGFLLVDTRNLAPEQYIAMPGQIRAFGFTPDGTSIAVAVDSLVKVLRIQGQIQLVTFSQPGVIAMEFSPDGSLFTTLTQQGVWLRSSAGGTVVRMIEVSGTQITGSAFSGNAELVTTATDGIVRVFRVSDGVLDRSWDTHASISSVSVSRDGSCIATGGLDGHVRVWEIASGLLLADFSRHVGDVRMVRLGPTGKLVISWGTEGQLRSWTRGGHWWIVP